MPCNKCPLGKLASCSLIEGIGNPNSKIMIVGDPPNYSEDSKGKYGEGNTYAMLKKLVKAADIKSYYYTPSVKCKKPQDGSWSEDYTRTCKEHLFAEIEKYKPDHVITLGSIALKALTNKAGINSLHGQVIDHKKGFKMYPTFSPGMAIRDPRFYDKIYLDFTRFGKAIRGEVQTEHKQNHIWVKNRSQLRKILLHIATVSAFAFDLETTGLQMRLPESEIGITAISSMQKDYVVDHSYFEFSTMRWFHKKLAKIAKGKTVVAHNGKFDNLWLRYQYKVRMPLNFDTILAGQLLDSNSPLDLKYLSSYHLNMPSWDVPLAIKKGVNRNGTPLDYEQKKQRAVYAGWDTYGTIRLYELFDRRLKEQPELNTLFHKVSMPSSGMYERVETNGVYIDENQFNQAEKTIDRKLKRLERRLSVFAKNYDKKDVKWNSADFVADILYVDRGLIPKGRTPKGKPSTAEDFLVKLRDSLVGKDAKSVELIELILSYRKYTKQKGTYIEGWKTRRINNYIFPSFNITGAITGRPSCSNPNLQQVPGDPSIRSLIGAPKGWVFFEVDYSQIELRIAAHLAREPTMLSVFRSGGDIHEATYKMVMGMSPDQACAHITDDIKRKAAIKEERKKAKAINFGFIYGMGWRSFMEYAETVMGLKISESQAKQWRIRYFQNYPKLTDWHDRQRRIVHALGEARTLTGRVRSLPQVNSPDKSLVGEAERRAINSPVQGFAAELMLMALIEIDEYFGNNVLKLQGSIHDAAVGVVREDIAEAAMSRVKEIMENPKLMNVLGIKLSVPVIADVTLGNWGVGKEYDPNELPEPLEIDQYDYLPMAA